MINHIQNNEFNDDFDFSAKLDFKFKSPIQLWLKGIYNQTEDIYFGTIGLGYLWNTKKWNVSVYSEKTYFQESYDKVTLIDSNQNFYFNTGFIFYFKNKIPVYLKYSNIYKNTLNENQDVINKNVFNKVDKIMFGTYFTMNKLIYSFGLDFHLKEFLHLNFDNTELSFTVGYKIL